MKNIGFIGLGNMGLEMAINLKKSEYNVTGFDINKNMYKRLNALNINTSNNIKNIFETNEIILTMLPDGKAVDKVYSENLKYASKNTLIVDCSTIDIETTIKIHNLAKNLKMLSLDAPVSGGVSGAKAASLTFMIGGKERVYKLMLPIFNAMGGKSIFCGQESSGQAVKICNNLILAISMIATGEAIILAKKLNLDLTKLYEVTSTSSASCWAINNYFPVANIGPVSPADNNFEAGFSVNLMKKDLSLALNSIKDNKNMLHFGELALDKYSKMCDEGFGNLDFSAVIKNYK